MKINYGKMLSDYFVLDVKCRKTQKACAEKSAECDHLRGITPGTAGSLPLISDERKLRETEAELQKMQELLAQLQRRAETMRFFLKNFSVSVGEALQVLFPQIEDPDLYEMTCESSFAKFCSTPISLPEALDYYDAQPKRGGVPLFKINVKNRRTFEEQTFYKFRDIDEEMADGSPIRSHLLLQYQPAPPSPVRYRIPFVLERERILLLNFHLIDFHYSALLVRHAFEIAEAKRRRDEG